MIKNATLIFIGKNPEKMLKRYVIARMKLGKWHEHKKSEEI
jgi:hypothetical protein